MKNIYEIYGRTHNNRRNKFELFLWNNWMSLELIRRLFKKVMHNKFRNVIEFMSLSVRRLSLQQSFELNIFFAHTISKLVRFTPLASANIPSKRQLLIMSANFLALYCASILDLLWCHCHHCRYHRHDCHHCQFKATSVAGSWFPVQRCRVGGDMPGTRRRP